MDVIDKAAVIHLAKTDWVHTRVVSNDNVILDDGDPRPGHSAYGHVTAVGSAVLERQITDGCVVVSAGVA